jgi:parallel beta-helix repeat protein
LLHENIAKFNAYSGLQIFNNCYNITIANNTAFSNECGILLENCNLQYVFNNSAKNNSQYGIHILGAYNNLVEQNNASLNGIAGIKISSGQSWGNVIDINIANENGYTGIEIANCNDNTISNNTIFSNSHGLSVANTGFTCIQSNEIQNNSVGLLIVNGHQNRIFNNVLNKSKIGMLLDSSSINYFGENSILNTTGMSGNSVYSSLETSIDVYQNDPDWSAYSSFEEQLATGDGGNPLFTRAVDLADTLVFEVRINGHANSPDLDLGIFLDGKDGNPVDGITQAGEIVAFDADANAQESVRLLAPEDGTYLIRVFGYTVNANPGQFDMEINIINGSSTGIYMMNSTHNRIVNNNISHNSQGLNLTMGSDFNRLNYNNIADNGVQAFDDGINHWNTSYPAGGNFWSDYAGTDTFSGPDQDIAGSDGIGDTPYDILGWGNRDEYPLMDYTDGVYIDNTPPNSLAYIKESRLYPEFNWGYCVVSASVSDDYSGVAGATMWYRYSPDNQTWGAWTEFTFYTPSTPSWTFDPIIMGLGGEGHYQFHTITTDGAGNVEVKPQAAEAYWLFDIAAPQSHMVQPTNYWNVPDLAMEVHVTDNTNSTANVKVFYRFSLDNATWGGWTLFENLTSEPWNFTFDFPGGQGYYQFYNRANDTSGNLENATAAAQARVGYDITSPLIIDNSPAAGMTGDAFTFAAQVTDNLGQGEVRVVYRFGSGTETNATMTPGAADSFEFDITIPTGSLDMLYYRIVAADEAGNWNSTGTRNVTITDNDDPAADPGPDQAVNAGTLVTFTGSGSTDNIGITNYTWNFTHNGTAIILYGVSSEFEFWAAGNYTVTLTVRDAAGNTDTDTMQVNVAEAAQPADTTPPVADAGPDQAVNAGVLVTFTGAGSTDNVGIANYTWTFTYNGTTITLYGVSPIFRFWTSGNYTVSLTVRDAAGNNDTDTVLIIVNPVTGPEDGGSSDYWGIILILIIVLAVGVLLGLKMLRAKKPETEEGAAENPIEEYLRNEQSTKQPKNE